MLIPKQTIIRNPKHLAFIRTLPCVKTGQRGEIEAAHIRYGFFTMGVKPSDNRVVPLRYDEHRKQHTIGEKKYWGDRMDKVIWLSGLIYDHTGEYETCCELIGRFRNGNMVPER